MYLVLFLQDNNPMSAVVIAQPEDVGSCDMLKNRYLISDQIGQDADVLLLLIRL